MDAQLVVYVFKSWMAGLLLRLYLSMLQAWERSVLVSSWLNKVKLVSFEMILHWSRWL